MKCGRCGDSAVTRRGEIYYCGRCALRADWESVVLTAQGMTARETVAGAQVHAPPPPPVGAPVAPSPADPFSS